MCTLLRGVSLCGESTGYVYSVKRVLTLGNYWVCVLC